mmetsp:Transcript_14364/g.30948  ORF Transcript_14364/g.30948 Transcript_14364/m.30948 type:complete len:209 (-) Transcript_14364:127-753(-)
MPSLVPNEAVSELLARGAPDENQSGLQNCRETEPGEEKRKGDAAGEERDSVADVIWAGKVLLGEEREECRSDERGVERGGDEGGVLLAGEVERVRRDFLARVHPHLAHADRLCKRLALAKLSQYSLLLELTQRISRASRIATIAIPFNLAQHLHHQLCPRILIITQHGNNPLLLPLHHLPFFLLLFRNFHHLIYAALVRSHSHAPVQR